ncbi:cobyric acid synthase [Peribacillus sp. SCS-37]|uniref:cobyric acid synthase n=1 Tax=Paraperibacillus esterisolvens TaxID=3115296 RepID=UPI0039068C13
MPKAVPLMFQGTSSDVGKSVIAAAFCRIFAQDGYRTAPFKSQNMALNSYITADGREIGRAQGMQAEAAGIAANTFMNPILIKPTREYESQIVVHGKPFKNMKAGAYRQEFFDRGLSLIRESLDVLSRSFDRLVIEGAGSPAEINLNDRELVNMRVARMADAPVILIGDIDRGGVFASLVGTLQLMEEKDRDRVIGVMINKFRGDVSLLQDGLDWFEEYTGKKVFGVIPYMEDLHIDAEDSLALNQYKGRNERGRELDIAVIQYPRISNFTDIDPLMAERDCCVRYVDSAPALGRPDLIVLPGSKNTIEDLRYIKERGLAEAVTSLYEAGTSLVFGICGGYQMLGRAIADEYAVESPFSYEKGLGILPIQTFLAREKKTVLSEGTLSFGGSLHPVKGYEIHMGVTEQEMEGDSLIIMKDGADGFITSNRMAAGTYFHGIFHNDSFRWDLLNKIRERKGLETLTNRIAYRALQEESFDRLAAHVREYTDLNGIEQAMKQFSGKGAALHD